jgi:hypothetical protein
MEFERKSMRNLQEKHREFLIWENLGCVSAMRALAH